MNRADENRRERNTMVGNTDYGSTHSNHSNPSEEEIDVERGEGGGDLHDGDPSSSSQFFDVSGGRCCRKPASLEDSPPAYDYRKHIPRGTRNPIQFARWLATGAVAASSPDDEEGGTTAASSGLSTSEVDENTRRAARMLSLLREYQRRFGLPDGGGPADEQWVLVELCRGLYSGGTPLWTLKPAMSRAATGMSGARGVEFCLLPRSAFVFAPTSGATVMFAMERGFSVSTLTQMERVLVRLASFASNTRSVLSVESGSPSVSVLLRASRGESMVFGGLKYTREDLEAEILDLASEGMGLFYLTAHAEEMRMKAPDSRQIQSFWAVPESLRVLFSRLATIEAVRAIEDIKERQASRVLYPRAVVMLFRFVSSAGAAGLWFSASWLDMLVAGAMGVMVCLLQSAHLSAKNERILLEVCASYIVGMVAGLLSMSFPGTLCFGGMAVGAVIEILQGFRIVYSIMEIMSKNSIAGGADFLEGVLFTGLISYFLKFGLSTASSILGASGEDINYSVCANPINSYFYFLLVPVTSLAWSVLFRPCYSDLPLMAYHGILSYVVHWAIGSCTGNSALATFVAALATTTSAGITSRFTGRQALGDTVTGLYVLLPGAYLVKGLFAAAEDNVIDSGLLSNIVVIAVTIGLGGWTGTLLCSPTILGTNKGLLNKSMLSGSMHRSRSAPHGPISDRERQARAMLFF